MMSEVTLTTSGACSKTVTPHPGGLAAYTEQAGPALANDVYFDLTAFGVELL